MLETKRRAITFITISIILAAIAGFMFLQKVKALNAELGGMTKVYVSSTDIPSREVITPEQVNVIELPNKFVTSSHIVDPEDIANKVSVVPLSKGDVITKNLLKPVSNVANENNRLVALFSSDKVSFDQELDNLDRVDIIVSHNFDGKAKTEIFMSDVLVYGVSKSDNKFNGVALEVPRETAPELIHMQNYADSLRVLKANVGKEQSITKEVEEEETVVETQAKEKTDKKRDEKKGMPDDKKKQSNEKQDK